MIQKNLKTTPATWCLRLLALPLTQIVLAVIFLALDLVGGPYVQFPIAYVLPVALAAHFSNPRLSCCLAVLQPLARLGFIFVWDAPWSLTISIINVIIRITVLLVIAYFVNRTTRLAREVKRLEGLLPICSFCKKIRTEQNEWQRIETYISKHSQADFTHGICPECARAHYAIDLEKPAGA